MGLNKIAATVPCSCGRMIEATSSQAGTKILCDCGSEIQLPKLSELRKLAGKHAYATNPAELIELSLAKGINPSGNSCLCCKSLNPIRFNCIAECESSVLKGNRSEPNSIPRLLAVFGAFTFLPKLLLLFIRNNRDSFDEPTIVGHDVTVEFPLMVCNRCVSSGYDPRKPSAAKKLMQKVALYQDLLTFYPDLHIYTR